MLKRSLLVLAVAVPCTLAGGLPASAGEGSSCPGAWGTWTIEDAVDYKLALGYPASREELLARAHVVDANDDEIVCLLEVPDSPANPPYIHIVSDNIANVP